MNERTGLGAEAAEFFDLHRLSTYQYHLPRDLIAQEPSLVRDDSRLLVLHSRTGEILHHRFSDLPLLLSPNDLLVLNETKVIPALLVGRKITGGRVEMLVLDPAIAAEGKLQTAVRTCMVKASKRLRRGDIIRLDDCTELLVEETPAPGRARVRFPVQEVRLLDFLDAHGQMPLPPYLKAHGLGRAQDRTRYQTVYSHIPGSVAAPTAGLHFTPDLLKKIEARGVETTRITLHVGPGTFTPVRHEDIRLHKMESETYDIPEPAMEAVNRARGAHRRIVAVGTTTVRALESAATRGGEVRAGAGATDLFIIPGYSFKIIHNMITNFHLPGSTLLMLVCALGGTGQILTAYRAAINQKYLFYSYGDACLIFD
ncbi:MAG TPA: tRNA preQ1(34) S-adenosylmethionine ribosyltransferase-isomerase QueA [Desulfomonilaceae bacterium]|nr:tRNA preQ1(34) S-adenosylmethionine ribosyltransferase-isomerase QueA [Desulfomonilaceae bacterium]